MKNFINKEKLEKHFKSFPVFVVTGLIFILVAKASINYQVLLSKLFSTILIELVFLSFLYVSLNFLFLKIKEPFLSYLLYYFYSGLLGLFLIEFLVNANNDLGIMAFIFLFSLKALEAVIARVSIDIEIRGTLRERFIKSILIAYLLYILFSFFAFSTLDGKNIWGFSFILLSFFIFILFVHFLYRLKVPKEKKEEKPIFDDVSFY
ncbi:MAG: hypothetical protein PF572_00855 [Patescibacteria group bacterium]|jgi:hypothetical protein|nr:hypothetical protein [Patescibacteria group bacterium]